MNESYVQTEAFPAPPKTRRELAEEFVEHFQADVESAQKSLGNAQARLTAAERLRDDAEENLRRAIAAESGDPRETALEALDEMRTAAEEAGIGLSIEFSGHEPVTIAEKPAEDPVVLAVYPDTGEAVETAVGPRTTYRELVADFITATGWEGELGELAVMAADGTGDKPRRPGDSIAADDHWKLLHVVKLVDSSAWTVCPVCAGDGRQPDKTGGGHHGVCTGCDGYGCVEREAVNGTSAEGEETS